MDDFLNDGLDVFYASDSDRYKKRVKIYNNLNVYFVEITEMNSQFVIDLTNRKFKSLTDYTIFPKVYDREMYDYIVTKLASLSNMTIVKVKQRFIYEE